MRNAESCEKRPRENYRNEREMKGKKMETEREGRERENTTHEFCCTHPRAHTYFVYCCDELRNYKY